jgi:hypothetical protein
MVARRIFALADCRVVAGQLSGAQREKTQEPVDSLSAARKSHAQENSARNCGERLGGLEFP